ncbi:MAG: hypothetical protein PsegKO_31540 [Pseudohongiellaceae bacterium]
MRLQAGRQFADNEHTANSTGVLTLAVQTGCSAQDCEFVSLAKSLNLKLVTGAGKLVETFPGIAITPDEYLRTEL